MRQVYCVLRVTPSNKAYRHDKTEIFAKVALNIRRLPSSSTNGTRRLTSSSSTRGTRRLTSSFSTSGTRRLTSSVFVCTS
jgi:hypothetical protein